MILQWFGASRLATGFSHEFPKMTQPPEIY